MYNQNFVSQGTRDKRAALNDGVHVWPELWFVGGLGGRSYVRKWEEGKGEGEKNIESMIQGEEDFKK